MAVNFMICVPPAASVSLRLGFRGPATVNDGAEAPSLYGP